MRLWCPSCGAEYVEGWTACSDCGVALVDSPPAESSHDVSRESPRSRQHRDLSDPFIDIWEGPTPGAEDIRRKIESRYIPVETDVGIDAGRARVQVPRSYLEDVRDVISGVAPVMPVIAEDTLDGFDWKPAIRILIVATAAVLLLGLVLSQFS